MTRKELIEGGWIDKYVLGLTSEEESQEVERLAAMYPDIQAQLNEARNKMCSSFNRGLKRTALQSSFLSKKRVLWGAAGGILLALGGLAFLCREHFSLQKDYLVQCDKLAREQAKVSQLSSMNMAAKEQSRFVNAASTERIKLRGCEAAPDAEVVVYKCKLSGKMMLRVIDLPPLPQGQHFEVWAHEGEIRQRRIGEILMPIKYDSLYILDSVLNSTTLEIASVDPVTREIESVCFAPINK